MSRFFNWEKPKEKSKHIPKRWTSSSKIAIRFRKAFCPKNYRVCPAGNLKNFFPRPRGLPGTFTMPSSCPGVTSDWSSGMCVAKAPELRYIWPCIEVSSAFSPARHYWAERRLTKNQRQSAVCPVPPPPAVTIPWKLCAQWR